MTSIVKLPVTMNGAEFVTGFNPDRIDLVEPKTGGATCTIYMSCGKERNVPLPLNEIARTIHRATAPIEYRGDEVEIDLDGIDRTMSNIFAEPQGFFASVRKRLGL